MNNSTPLFNEIISKKAENNNGFLIVGCHGKGKPMASIKNKLAKERIINEEKNKSKVPYFKSLKFVDHFRIFSQIIEFGASIFICFWYTVLFYCEKTSSFPMNAFCITSGIYLFMLFLICIISKNSIL